MSTPLPLTDGDPHVDGTLQADISFSVIEPVLEKSDPCSAVVRLFAL